MSFLYLFTIIFINYCQGQVYRRIDFRLIHLIVDLIVLILSDVMYAPVYRLPRHLLVTEDLLIIKYCVRHEK